MCCIDRGGSYQASVKEHLPDADIVYDKFHIIANYNEVIDKIRRREWRQAEEDDKPFIKGQRFNLFRNPENITPQRESSLKELLAMNENLFQAYTLKDMLKQLWTYTYKACASKFLDRWIELAKATGIGELQRFAKGLDRAREGLLSYCHHRITSAKIEAFNGVIKRIVYKSLWLQRSGIPLLKNPSGGSDLISQPEKAPKMAALFIEIKLCHCLGKYIAGVTRGIDHIDIVSLIPVVGVYVDSKSTHNNDFDISIFQVFCNDACDRHDIHVTEIFHDVFLHKWVLFLR